MNMTPSACNARMRIALQFAQEAITEDHDHAAAVRHLRRALQHAVGAKQGRAWSKLMLAIRELSRIASESEGIAQESLGILSSQIVAFGDRGYWPRESFLTELIQLTSRFAQFLSVPPFSFQPI